MKHIENKIGLLALAFTSLAAHAHPGHPESDHFVGGFIAIAAGVYAIKQGAALLARRTVRIRKR